MIDEKVEKVVNDFCGYSNFDTVDGTEYLCSYILAEYTSDIILVAEFCYKFGRDFSGYNLVLDEGMHNQIRLYITEKKNDSKSEV